jgi:SMI1 / KNR4 family (SUKH-1)
MPFTPNEIENIESTYGISLPASYKKMLLVIGDKLLDTKPSFLAPDLNIYTLQEDAKEMMEAMEEDGIIFSYQLTNAFFIMMLSSTILTRYYFIHPLGQKDCSVYCWKIYDDLNLVEEVSSTIDGWLCEASFFLYVEAKVKGLF